MNGVTDMAKSWVKGVMQFSSNERQFLQLRISLLGHSTAAEECDCSENGNEIARGAAECYFVIIATMSETYPKILLLPVLSQINTIVFFVKVKLSYFQTRFRNE